MAAGILGGDLALAERGVRELPVTGAVADGVDVVVDCRGGALPAAMPLRGFELDADLGQAKVLDHRAAPDGDEHQVGLDGFAVAGVTVSCEPSSSTFVHCFSRCIAMFRR